MKKMLGFVLALVLLVAACTPAMAAGSVIAGQVELKNISEASLNKKTNTIIVGDREAGCYVLMDAHGNRLTTTAYKSMRSNDAGFEVAIQDGINNIGFIDGNGKELVPMAYGDIIYIDANWQLGVVLENATVDNYDYKSFSGDAFYLVSAYDVFYCGTRIGSLGRTEYYNAKAYGKYLYVTDEARNGAAYDTTFTRHELDDGYGEYTEDYKTDTIWHRGSGQQAFCAGCTLTSADVQQDLYIYEGKCYDLQGNVVFEEGAYEATGSWLGDYIRVRSKDGKYGVIDRTGRLVIPCEYESIDHYNDELGEMGYQGVVKDGKFGYVNMHGEVTCPFTYSESNVSYGTSPLISLTDMEGKSIVLSAAVGELPERYAEVSIGSRGGSPVFAAMDDNGNAGVVDMYGNVVIPFDGTYDSVYDFNISEDGSVIVTMSSGVAHIYALSFTGEAVSEPAQTTDEAVSEPAQTTEEAVSEPAQADDGSWTCACGTENSGKFCTECGTAKPAPAVSCSGCGYTPAEGETPKFCLECGTAF